MHHIVVVQPLPHVLFLLYCSAEDLPATEIPVYFYQECPKGHEAGKDEL
jgi:hypothetical protein